MKKIIFLVLLILPIFCINVFAQYSESEDFENYEVGVLPNNWTSGYNIGEYGTKITTDPENLNNKVISIKANAARTQSVFFLENSYSGKVTLEYDMYIKSTSSLQHTPCAGYNGSDIIGTMMQNNNMIYGGGTSLLYVKGFTYDKWHHVKIDMDIGALIYSYYLDNNKVFSSQRNLSGGVFEINSITTTAESTEMYIDNIVITQTGESTEIKNLLYSSEYAIDRDNFTIGDLGFYDDVKKVIDSLRVVPGANISVEGDNITVQLGDRIENYQIIRRKSEISKKSQFVINNCVIFKIGENTALNKGTAMSIDNAVFINKDCEVTIPLSTVQLFYNVTSQWNEEKFAVNYIYNDYSVLQPAKYTVGNKDGYRIKVLEDGYLSNLNLCINDMNALGTNTKQYGEYVIISNSIADIDIKAALSDIKKVF